MAKEERIGNTRKKVWQEGDSNRKVNGAMSQTDLLGSRLLRPLIIALFRKG